MTQSTNKFEQLLELLINEENDKAQALFHEIVVEKSRDIYEGLAETETAVEAKEMKKDEKDMKEAEVSEVMHSKMHDKKDMEAKDSKDESVDEEVEIEETSTEQESIEEVGGDATDDLIADVEAEEKGDAEDYNKDGDIDSHEKDHAEVEDKIVDLEDALEELKAEFEKMMNGDKSDMDMKMDKDESVAPAQDAQVEVAATQEAMKHDMKKEAMKHDMKKETVKEYKIQKSADNKGGDDKSAKSPVAGKNDMGGTSANIAKAQEDNKKVPVATAKKMDGNFENTGGKDKATSYKKEVKADLKDGGDKSASKSPIVAVK